MPNKSNSYYLAAKTDFIDKIILDFIDFLWMAFCTGKNVINFTKRKNGGHFERRAPIGRRNMPRHSYITAHLRR